MTTGDDANGTESDTPVVPDRDGGVETMDEFHTALENLVSDAVENGVDIHGNWPVATEDSWDIDIRRVAHRSRSTATDPDKLMTRLVEDVAARVGVEPTELAPLHDVIEPEILELLCARETTRGHITFQYVGYDVTVNADGTIFVDG
jgi:hypothetical protein